MSSVLTREQLLDELLLECHICKHLHGKLAQEAADYRPTEKQRSTLELLRYLAVCGIAPARGMLVGHIWRDAQEHWKRTSDMTFDEFPAAMDRQAEELREVIMGLSDEDLASRTGQNVTGEMVPFGYLLVKTSLKWLTAYRMQLFLYAKSAGAEEIGTANNWAGMDWKK